MSILALLGTWWDDTFQHMVRAASPNPGYAKLFDHLPLEMFQASMKGVSTLGFMRKKSWIVGLGVFVMSSVAIVATMAATPGDPRQLSEGADLLDQAGITVDEAIAAAQQVVSGDVQEVELERENGTLIFEVQINGREVVIDAATGAYVGLEVETGNEKDDDD